MLKLETNGNSGVLSISGRVGAENLSELKLQMEAHPSPIVLELGEVTLADADAGGVPSRGRSSRFRTSKLPAVYP